MGGSVDPHTFEDPNPDIRPPRSMDFKLTELDALAVI